MSKKEPNYEDLTPHQKIIVANVLNEAYRTIYLTLGRSAGKTTINKIIRQKLKEMDIKDHGG